MFFHKKKLNDQKHPNFHSISNKPKKTFFWGSHTNFCWHKVCCFYGYFFGGSPNCSKNFPAPLLFIKLNFYTQRKINFPGSRIYKMPTNNRFKRCHDFKKSDSAPNFYLHILKKLSSICIFWYRKKKVCNLLFEE